MHSFKFSSACLAAALLAALSAAASEPPETSLAWRRDGQVEWRRLQKNGTADAVTLDADTRVPLGSLWKLFVFTYLSERQAREPAYTCMQNRSTRDGEEEYCCEPGNSIDRNHALAQSCAPYFSFARLAISQDDWRAFWRGRSSATWLLDTEALNPATEVRVDELLAALDAIPARARSEARLALLEVGLHGYGREGWTTLGTGVRYKTYSWHRADGSAFGGAAGWLADGTPFWFGARGSSRTAIATWAPLLATALPAPRWQTVGRDRSETTCVDVDFFARYPLRAVWHATDTVEIKPGNLKGRYRLQFANGNWLNIASRGELVLNVSPQGVPQISGRFPLNDYVARVIDREGDAQYTEAARALAIAARSYLVQNGHFEAGCWHIADASNTQRVSASAPSDAALAAAWFSDDIFLQGVPVQYHRDRAAPNRLAWSEAVAKSGEKQNFEQILLAAFPQARIASLGGREECTRLDAAEQWLRQSARMWDARLQREPGYEAPASAVRICALNDGNPYSDQQRLRVYVRGWRTLDERVALTHEYLHLSFRFHPNGADERYIERLARKLIEG